MKIALINMPFNDFTLPSIGISLLQAGLRREGIACDSEVGTLICLLSKLPRATSSATRPDWHTRDANSCVVAKPEVCGNLRSTFRFRR
jgi:hypothetical protein